MMTEVHCSGLGAYIITVRSHLDDKKSYWFEGLTMTTGYDEDGRPITTFTGHLADQAALHGVLAKIRDMNLPLISVSQLELGSSDEAQSGNQRDRQG
jgi:hypothetical protein